MYDIIVIGAGPAGMTAALYARRAAKKVLILEGKCIGGQIINTPDVENFPVEEHISGFDFANRLYEQTKNAGAEFIFEKAVALHDGAVKTVTTPKNAYECRSVIIAAGNENRKLGVEGEDALVGRGVSYCATCDGSFYKNKTVAVVGGGNTALDDALYLSDIAEKVYLVHRRSEFRGEEMTVKLLRSRSNVEFILNSTVTKLIADKKLAAVEVTDKDGAARRLDVNGLFVAVGRIPDTGAFADAVALDGSGYIVAGENCRTDRSGIFAAGDCRTKDVRQLVTAAGDGAVAATEAVRYLNSSV